MSALELSLIRFTALKVSDDLYCITTRTFKEQLIQAITFVPSVPNKFSHKHFNYCLYTSIYLSLYAASFAVRVSSNYV